MNIRYFDPIDGHDVKSLSRILRGIKDLKNPRILHLHAIKGKGFAPAGGHATKWHAPGKFGPVTGERFVVNTEEMSPLFRDVFGSTLVELAEANPKIVGVIPAMLSSCSMDIPMSKVPKRTFDMGIAEGHAVTFSGGMAEDGLQPLCDIYSSFMQRAYDNIIHDVAIQNLPIILCLDHTKLVGKDGPAYHGMFDMVCLRPISSLTIVSPMNKHELRRLMYTVQLPGKGPFVLHYPRGHGVLVGWKCPLEETPIGKGRKLKDGGDIAVINIEPIGNKARNAIARAEPGSGGSIAHYDLRFLRPLDEELLHEVGRVLRHIVTIKGGTIQGGMGSAVLEFMADHEYTPTVRRIGTPDKFVQHGAVTELYQFYGMDEDSLTKELLKQYELLPNMNRIRGLADWR